MRTMFERYHVEVKEALPKFKIPPEFIVRRFNNCTNVQECTQSCVFGVHVVGNDGKIEDPREDLCRGCFRCVIECPDLAISVEANPEFSKLGNTYFTSDRIRTIFFETQTGKVPVSGTGYGGPFAGKGFDGIWFDFSEIVRPTRDEIHGREFVSTSVDLGRKPSRLFFDEGGNLISTEFTLVEIPLPMFLDAPLKTTTETYLPLALAKAASELKTFAIINLESYTDDLIPYALNIIPRISPEQIETAKSCIEVSRIVEVKVDGNSAPLSDILTQIKEINPGVLVAFNSTFDETSPEIAFEMAKIGADIIHFQMSDEIIEQDPNFITNAIRQVHNYLVEKNIRDEVTIISSGGIAEPPLMCQNPSSSAQMQWGLAWHTKLPWDARFATKSIMQKIAR